MISTRRDLIRYFAATSGCFVAAGSPTALLAAVNPGTRESAFSYPQGVASADPQSDAIVIWTRITGSADAIPLVAQVARDAEFESIVAEVTAKADPDLDFTVRILVTNLDPDRHYYYRFIAPDGGTSRVGRSRTAPAPDDLRPLNVAVFSCQDYELGYFTAYRHLLDNDANATPDRAIDFVLHVGDFIYETTRDVSSEESRKGLLRNADGSLRKCGPLPSGGVRGRRGRIVPNSLDDYRTLYRAYLSDPDLQDARARYPFVQTWDDHELKNDYWQSYAAGRSIAELKVAANQVWFEFVPAALSAGGRDVNDHRAKDFEPVSVTNNPAVEFDDHYLSLEENNLSAIESMTIYRSLRWGQLASLFVIDGRSYRGPRGLPQELLTVGRFPYPPAPVDSELIDILSEGRTARGGNPPDEIAYMGKTYANPRKTAPRGSMLGKRQKEWLLEELSASKTVWNLLGFNVGLMRHGFDDSFREEGGANRILWTDGWDGYPAERRELCDYFRQNAIKNLVSLTGDRHLHIAGLVYDDFDDPDPTVVAAEFAGGAISATDRLNIQKGLSAHDEELAALVSFDGTEYNYDSQMVPSLNAWMLFGAAAARALADGIDEADAIRRSNKEVNSHLRYVDADAHGYFVSRFTQRECVTDFVVIERPVKLPADGATPAERRRVSLSVESWSDSGEPVMSLVEVRGQPPLAGLKF